MSEPVQSKSLEDLEPDVRAKVEQLLKLAADEGLDARVLCTYRNCARQQQLKEQKISPIGGCYSWHTWKRAADVFLYEDGKMIKNGGDPKYTLLGGLGKTLDLVWGGDFKIKDPCHFEYHPGLKIWEVCPDQTLETCEARTRQSIPVTPEDPPSPPPPPSSEDEMQKCLPYGVLGDEYLFADLDWALGREYVRLHPGALDLERFDTLSSQGVRPTLGVAFEQASNACLNAMHEGNVVPGMALIDGKCILDYAALACFARTFWEYDQAGRPEEVLAQLRTGVWVQPECLEEIAKDPAYSQSKSYEPAKEGASWLAIGAAAAVLGVGLALLKTKVLSKGF